MNISAEMLHYLFYGFTACASILVITPAVRWLAVKIGAIDVPRPPRKLHTQSIPLAGGMAIYFVVTLLMLLYLFFGNPNSTVMPDKFLWGIIAGITILIIGGILDDKFNAPPTVLWIPPALAALIAVWVGIGGDALSITNPLGGTIVFNYHLGPVPLAPVLIWLWFMGMMFTTKFLDGLDGLVAGVGSIASFTLFGLSVLDYINQPTTATLAVILGATLFGYLFYAFHPAKVFLGEGGSTVIGFLLGAISIILGGKLATAFLVMGLPILDVAWVLMQRIATGHNPAKGDRLHLHFRLLDAGFSQRQAAIILYCISAGFGAAALLFQSWGKVIALLILFILMILLSSVILPLLQSKRSATYKLK